MKKYICGALAFVLLIFAGCGPAAPAAETTAPIGTTVPIPDCTISTAPADPTVPTGVSEPTTAPTETTEPVAPTTVPTEPTEPAPTEPTAVPTEPSEPVPATVPTEVTEPVAPTIVPVEPTTAPTEPPHTHSYKANVTSPTCTEGGFTTYTCSCGDRYVADLTEPLGHEEYLYWHSEPGYLQSQEGRTTYKCSRCDEVISRTIYYMSDEDRAAWLAEYQRLVTKYINEYRVAEGSTELELLPGLCNVSYKYTTEVLDKNGCQHDRHGLWDILEELQYGRYYDATEYGHDPSNSHWTFDGTEAICDFFAVQDVDTTARRTASVFQGSSAHWSYLGSSLYSYIGVAISPYTGNVCIHVTRVNYG